MATQREPWRGKITAKDYNDLTSRMSAEGKKQFDVGFIENDPDFYMSLGATGFFIKANEGRADRGLPPVEKDYMTWWNMYT